ncbi:hypothetical protein OG585_03820 [Streptomyces sp. NBC_01340]|jgi:hypothetical protein|uniref:hypothetical protein n=1 Tax=unclassified Streptomyces TaxID=2593676 RepID=UPI00224F38E2|nr:MULTISPECIES: hypothetical protein [unclassified Streptomyces]MCX4402983.1 hypothetical protein [Streptomyces sp. NBC_01764]MCX4451803.1 hypothetical protein [Streptomyces sp. NBC_01719]MCX4491163.1 hypothetical protein [Streptomyces sp. NBC_01728]MCX5088003.1 hypothetical protein [Streptomyces sp. NBC_00365]MCX5182044.1 hypothetical protein [Streptomyces sp. NBC_00268]
MAEGNSYFADPARIQGGVRQIDQISTIAQEMIRDFVNEVNLTRDWPGTSDSFAREVVPQEKKERDGSADTGQALRDAIVSVANGTTENLKNILTTQGGNLDAIHESSGGGHTGGRH